MDSGETAPFGRGAEGERRSSQAKGTGSGRYSEKAGYVRPPKVQPAPDGAGNLSGQDTGAQSNGFAPFFAAQKQEGTTLKEELRK